MKSKDALGGSRLQGAALACGGGGGSGKGRGRTRDARSLTCAPLAGQTPCGRLVPIQRGSARWGQLIPGSSPWVSSALCGGPGSPLGLSFSSFSFLLPRSPEASSSSVSHHPGVSDSLKAALPCAVIACSPPTAMHREGHSRDMARPEQPSTRGRPLCGHAAGSGPGSVLTSCGPSP